MRMRWHGVVGMFFCVQLSGVMGAPAVSLLRSFGSGDLAAANPCAELVEGPDGALYGTAPLGGNAGQGTVFRVGQDGSGFRLLRSFGSVPAQGAHPVAALTSASDGALYGTTAEGGQFGCGTLFRLSADGSNCTVLKSFNGTNDGGYPEAPLLEASDGLLYGTTSGGGTNDLGVVFRIGKDGLGFLPLVRFSGTNGANPAGGLTEGSDGRLYGVTRSGGVTNLPYFTCVGTASP